MQRTRRRSSRVSKAVKARSDFLMHASQSDIAHWFILGFNNTTVTHAGAGPTNNRRRYHLIDTTSYYIQGPLKANFDKNDGLDMGLYYVHGRWYNQDTGLYLSPDGTGTYFYFNDDPVNKHTNAPMAPVLVPPECAIGFFANEGGAQKFDARDLTCWLFREMKHNLDDPDLQALKRTVGLSHATLAAGVDLAKAQLNPFLPPPVRVILFGWSGVAGGIGGLSYGVGFIQYYNLVGPSKIWDFKPKITEYLGNGITLCSREGCDHRIEKSVPGNIHFGFVSREAGYSEFETEGGAAFAEGIDSSHRLDPKDPDYSPYRPYFGWYGSRYGLGFGLGDAQADNRAVDFGVKLYDRHANGRGLTFATFQMQLEYGIMYFQNTDPSAFPVNDNIARNWPYWPGFFSPTK